jgi:predicted RecB family nuclease
MVSYWDYLDGAGDAIMDNVLTYNEDDCRAMWHIDHELTKRL